MMLPSFDWRLFNFSFVLRYGKQCFKNSVCSFGRHVEQWWTIQNHSKGWQTRSTRVTWQSNNVKLSSWIRLATSVNFVQQTRVQQLMKFIPFSRVLKVYMTDFFICLIKSKWHPDMNIKNYFSNFIFLPRAFAVWKREILLPVMSKTAQRETWA